MTTAEEYLASQIGDDTPAISAAEYLDQQIPEDKPTFMSRVENAANAPFAGIMNAATNTALGATQAAASFANQAGILPDTMNVKIPGVGMMDLGYNAGNQGINELKAAKDEDTAATYADDGLSNGLYMGGNVAGDMALFDRLGGNASKVAGPIGNVLNKIPYVGKPLASLFPAINAGATSAYVQPAADADQRDSNSIWGGLAGGLGKGLSDTLGTQVTNPALAKLMQTAETSDIPVYRYQTSDSKFPKALAGVLRNLPGGGGGKAAEEQVGAFNAAVNKTVGQGGEVTNSTVLGDAQDEIGKVYNSLKVHPFKSDPTFDAQLKQLSSDAQVNLVGDQKQLFNQQLSQLKKNLANGQMTGEAVKSTISNLGSSATGANGSPQLRQLRSLINQQWASGMPPKDAIALGLADKQWRNLVALTKPVGQNPNGPITPLAIQGGVKSVFGNYARGGDSSLENLSRLGQIIGKNFPDSGTATNEAIINGLKHVASTAGVAGVGGLAAEDTSDNHFNLGRDAIGAGAALMLARYGLSPYVFSKMGLAPASFGSFAPGAASAFTNQYNDGSQ